MRTTLLAGTLIDGTGAPPLEDARITIDDGQITAIGQIGPQEHLANGLVHDYRDATAQSPEGSGPFHQQT
jgi:N-acyl-D-aspartate/D-glutamate deacylase